MAPERSKFVEEVSDEDDDIIILPFVKPPPPIIILSASEDEGQDDNCGSNAPLPSKTKKSSSRSACKSQGVESDALSRTGREKRINETEQETGNVDLILASNIFDPSDTAVMENSSQHSAVRGDATTCHTFSPSTEKKKRRQSTLVRKEYENFLIGINLPPPPPVTRKRKSKTSGNACADTNIEQRKRSKNPAEKVAKAVTKKGKGKKESQLEKSNSTPKRKPKKLAKSRKRDEPMPDASHQPVNCDEPEPCTSRKKVTEKAHTSPVRHPSVFPMHWDDGMKQFYGSIDKNDFRLQSIMSSQPDQRSLWRAPEDSRPYKNRQRKVPCEICSRYGHHPVRCPQRGLPTRCVFCSNKGHTKDACPHGICLFCGSKQSKVQKTCSDCLCLSRRKKPNVCSLCSVEGHTIDKCPDNWRRYHSTTIELSEENKKLDDLKSKLKSRKSEKRSLERGTHPGNKSDFEGTLQKVSEEISKLQEQIKEIERKICDHTGTNTKGEEVQKYVEKYLQYCCNCSAQGHSYINCTKEQAKWTGKMSIVPNSPYVIKALDEGNHMPETRESPPEKSSESIQTQSNASSETYQKESLPNSESIEKPGIASSSWQQRNFRDDRSSHATVSHEPMYHQGSTTFRQHPRCQARYRGRRPRPYYRMGRGRGQNFYEDDMPGSYNWNTSQRFGGLQRPFQHQRPPLPRNQFDGHTCPHVSEMWTRGLDRPQCPGGSNQPEVITVPIPYPVPIDEYEKYRRGGFSNQFQFQCFANMPIGCVPSNSVPLHQAPANHHTSAESISSENLIGRPTLPIELDHPLTLDSNENSAAPSKETQDIQLIAEIPGNDRHHHPRRQWYPPGRYSRRNTWR